MAWSPLQEFVTLEQAKSHLKLSLDADTEDEDLQTKLFVAHEVVMDYLTQRVSSASDWEATVQAWTADTVPKRVIAAILIQFGELYRDRGDSDTNEVLGRWTVSYTHLRAHETPEHLVCRLLLEQKN